MKLILFFFFFFFLNFQRRFEVNKLIVSVVFQIVKSSLKKELISHIFVVAVKKKNGRLGTTSNFVFRNKKSDSHFDTTLKISYFGVKERMAVERMVV